jgi:DNA-binding response OmpR family regulator
VPLILIVDDDEAMRGLIRERLEDAYKIIDTGNPQDALSLALQSKPDCILLDLMMPEFSGFELCQTLASLSFTRLIPIFVITGEPAARYKDSCMSLGAKEYFEKPLNFGQLRSRLAAVLESKQHERRAEVRVRLRALLKLRGTATSGRKFELLTTTDDVSASGFLCGCHALLERDATVEVWLRSAGVELHVGRARMVRVEWPNTAWQRHGFRFVEKPHDWILR